MITARALTSVALYTDGAAAAVPIFAGTDMAVDAEVLFLDATHEHADVPTSAGDEAGQPWTRASVLVSMSPWPSIDLGCLRRSKEGIPNTKEMEERHNEN